MPGFNICGTGDGPSATLETARQHRWRITIWRSAIGGVDFGGGGEGILMYAYKGSRPRPEIDIVTLHHGQDEAYFPGKNKWGTVDFTFYEVLDGEGDAPARFIYRWWAEQVVNLEQSRLGDPQNIKAGVEYQLEDGGGRPVYKYVLYGAWPHKVDPADLDFTGTGLAEITVTLRYDKAREMTGTFSDTPGGTPGTPPGSAESGGSPEGSFSLGTPLRPPITL